MKKVSFLESIAILKNHGIVAFPTETVYGLGAIATSKDAVAKVFSAKNRPSDNPLICHFSGLNQILEYVENVPTWTKKLILELTPGPISFLLKIPKGSILSPATAGQDKVACRIPNHPLTLELLQKLNIPLVGPSANISGRPSGTSADMIINQFKEKIDGVLDGGKSKIGIESTILDCTKDGEVIILRPGAIGEEELLEVIKKLNLSIKIVQPNEQLGVIPGSKYRHYSPETELLKIQTVNQILSQEKYVVLATTEIILEYNLKNDLKRKIYIIDLGSKKNLINLAQNLYSCLFKVDTLNVNTAFLVEEDFGCNSLAIALKNRINRIGL